MSEALSLARALEPELIELRRDLHRHPEVAWEEVRTGCLAGDFCEKLGLRVTRQAAKTGVVATLNPEQKGPALALRADMDALPIHEENDVAYRSTRDGKGHLCGHDAHTAMLLGAVKVLSGLRSRIPFPVRFFFQPAEEVPNGGAEALIREGHLDGVEEVFGIHVNPQIPTGMLGLHSGATMASMDRIAIELSGVGGHAAMPHLARDPIVAAAETVMALQTVVARRLDPLEPAVVSICQIEAGSAFNVIPSTCRMVGTARCLSARVHEQLPEWVEEIAVGLAKAHGLHAKLDYMRGTPVLVNAASSIGRMGGAFRKLGGRETEISPTMGSEDFACYLERLPGCFAFLGAGDGSPDTAQCFHHPRYNIDEKALAWGTALFVQLVLDRAAGRS
ncbi:MAG: amidohydrolase [Planctomycetes bacterium]|nr:amidohydrolase [Planctomycetota bacterium]